jgi:hypothetical protein
MSRILHLHNGSKLKKSIPSLFIGHTGIQYIKLDNEKKPKKFGEISFSNKDDENEVKEGLRILVKKNKFKKVNLVIPDSEISTFFITVYLDSRKNKRSAIEDYIQKNIQMDPKEIVLDYDVVSYKDNVLSASVVVISKTKYNWYKEILSSLKIKAERIIGESLALSKSIIKNGNNEPHLIINILPRYTTLSMIGDGVVYKTDFLNGSIDDVNKFSKKINSFMLSWYSQIGRVVHDRSHHIVVISHDDEMLKKTISSLRNVLNHIDVRKGSAWDNCFDIDDYIPKIHKKDLYRYSSAIGGCLFK